MLFHAVPSCRSMRVSPLPIDRRWSPKNDWNQKKKDIKKTYQLRWRSRWVWTINEFFLYNEEMKLTNNRWSFVLTLWPSSCFVRNQSSNQNKTTEKKWEEMNDTKGNQRKRRTKRYRKTYQLDDDLVGFGRSTNSFTMKKWHLKKKIKFRFDFLAIQLLREKPVRLQIKIKQPEKRNKFKIQWMKPNEISSTACDRSRNEM